MSLRNTEISYGKLSIILHWLMSVMIICMIAGGFLVENMGKGEIRDLIAALHKSTGFLILLLALFRWYWMLSNKRPQPVDGVSRAEIAMAHVTKWLLMLAMIGMPLSGLLMVMLHGHGIDLYGLFEIPSLLAENKTIGRIFGKLHSIGGYAISVVVGLHIAGAIYHHFIKKDNTLNRMLGR
jgi:cytochrome b561